MPYRWWPPSLLVEVGFLGWTRHQLLPQGRFLGLRHAKTAIHSVRHLFLEADTDGAAVMAAVEARPNLPAPSYILESSPNRVHLFWRVAGSCPDRVERLQKHLAAALGTDPAATAYTQTT